MGMPKNNQFLVGRRQLPYDGLDFRHGALPSRSPVRGKVVGFRSELQAVRPQTLCTSDCCRVEWRLK